MRDLLFKIQTLCPKIRHFVLPLAVVAVGSQCYGTDQGVLEKFNPTVKINTRAPGNFVADVDYIQAPVRKKEVLEKVFVEDKAGVLKRIKRDLSEWERQEEYLTSWDLTTFGNYSVVTSDRKQRYLGKRLLKYVDKRISGEVKAAKKGSTLAAVGKAQTALKPNTKVSLSKNVKLKFKARVLQGKAIMNVVNPYVDYKTTVSATGEVSMKMKKELKEIRAVASVEYKPTESIYMTDFKKRLTDNINLNISSTQKHDKAVFGDDSEQMFRVNYYIPYEF